MSHSKLNDAALRGMKSITPIAMLTAYTTPIARCLEKAGVPVILVGDTVGMVEMGFDSTRHVTIEHMQYHIGAVRRGAGNTHIIGDLPYNSDRDPQTALQSASLLLSIGLGDKWPPFSRQYAYIGKTVVDVAETFVRQVTERTF